MDTPEQQIKNDRERKARTAMKTAATDRTTITYTDLLTEINWNVLPKSPQLTDLLCKISAASLESDGILLSAVVVNADSEQKGHTWLGVLRVCCGKGIRILQRADLLGYRGGEGIQGKFRRMTVPPSLLAGQLTLPAARPH